MGTPTAAYPRTRPLGVAILAVLVGLFGLILVLSGLLALVGAVAISYLGRGFVGYGGLPLFAVGAIVLILGVIVLASALGLWHLRMWALVLAVIISFIELLSYALSAQFLGFAIVLVIFVYLIAVRRHFT